jgi:orotidine-5'-phosphate decarboxylase
MATDSKIIVALDFPTPEQAIALADQLDPERCKLKIGKEMFTHAGPSIVETMQKKGFDVFLDLKYHDIPNTVAGACKAAASLGVWMVNVHTLGGRKMMNAAAEALQSYQNRPLLIGVTILTSMGEEDLAEVGIAGTPLQNVLSLAALAKDSGLDGVVCSPKEVPQLRQTIGTDFNLVTPGIRPAWSAKGDQNRITTPSQAIEDGSSYLVIGRPITAAEEPLKALEMIEKEILQGSH